MKGHYTAAMRQVLPRWTLLACGTLLAACGSNPASTSGTTSLRDALYFSTTTVPVGYVGETYEAPVTVAGGAGPYSLRLASGDLPPGVQLRNMQLAGTPSKVGSYSFSLETSDANLSSKVQAYTLNVQELPPLALKPQLPTAEIRGETRIPVNITAPRTVRAARVTWKLPEGVAVTRVQAADAGGVLFWKQSGRVLTLDMGFKTVPRSGTRVALIGVKPQKMTRLDAAEFSFEARDGAGKLLAPEAEVTKPAAPTPTGTPPAESAPPNTSAPASTPTETAPVTPPPADTAPADASPDNPVPPPPPADPTPQDPAPQNPGGSS